MSTTTSSPAKLVVALDVPTLRDAEILAESLSDLPVILKVGHQLAYTGGLGLAAGLVRAGREVFLDLKLHDIPRTVQEGVRSLAEFGAAYLTIHAYPQTVAAAVAGRGASTLRLLAVTVLTSMDDADARDAGYAMPVLDLVRTRARQATDLGADGLVCAAPEASSLRAIVGAGRLLVVPGIRPAGAEAGDQKRAVTPAVAIASGADHLVVGRPIAGAAEPGAAARAILAEMAAARRPASVAQPVVIGRPAL